MCYVNVFPDQFFKFSTASPQMDLKINKSIATAAALFGNLTLIDAFLRFQAR